MKISTFTTGARNSVCTPCSEINVVQGGPQKVGQYV